jgi:hypothetical protein
MIACPSVSGPPCACTQGALPSPVLPCARSTWTQSEGRLERQVRQNNHPQWRGHHGLATSKTGCPARRLSTNSSAGNNAGDASRGGASDNSDDGTNSGDADRVGSSASGDNNGGASNDAANNNGDANNGDADNSRRRRRLQGWRRRAGRSRRPAKGWLAREARRALRTTTPFPFRPRVRGRLEC